MEKPEQHTIYKTKESLLVGGVFFFEPKLHTINKTQTIF